MTPAPSSDSPSETAEVVRLQIAPGADAPEAPHELRREYVAAVRAGVDVLNARLLGLIAVLGGVGIWTWAVMAPAPWTFITGCGYSAGVVIPTLWLFGRKG